MKLTSVLARREVSRSAEESGLCDLEVLAPARRRLPDHQLLRQTRGKYGAASKRSSGCAPKVFDGLRPCPASNILPRRTLSAPSRCSPATLSSPAAPPAHRCTTSVSWTLVVSATASRSRPDPAWAPILRLMQVFCCLSRFSTKVGGEQSLSVCGSQGNSSSTVPNGAQVSAMKGFSFPGPHRPLKTFANGPSGR